MIKSASQSGLTTDIKYRNMGAANVPSSEYLIETALVTSPVPNVTFSNLNQYAGIYKHFQVVFTVRTSETGATSEDVCFRFNGNSSNLYTEHGLNGNGSSVSSGALTSFNRGFCGNMPTALEASNIFGASIVEILDPFAAKNKTVRALFGRHSSAPIIGLKSSMWMSTDSVTSLQFFTSSNRNFVIGSRFSLYGVTA